MIVLQTSCKEKFLALVKVTEARQLDYKDHFKVAGQSYRKAPDVVQKSFLHCCQNT